MGTACGTIFTKSKSHRFNSSQPNKIKNLFVCACLFKFHPSLDQDNDIQFISILHTRFFSSALYLKKLSTGSKNDDANI